jgi:putative hydrolase of the HAD superfamily
MTREPIRALILDYGNVLSQEQPADWFEVVGGRLGVTAPEFQAAYWQHRLAYDSGISAQEYWQRVLTALPCRAGDHDSASLTDWLIDSDVGSWTGFREEMWSLVKRFRARGARTAILSNGGPEVTAGLRARRRLEEWFDVVIVSCEVGVCKPDPRIYQLCLSRLDVEPGEALFVDDRVENVQAAAALGLQTVHYTGDHLLPEIRARIEARNS